MEDYQILLVVFSSMSIIFLVCSLPVLLKTCNHNLSVNPIIETPVPNKNINKKYDKYNMSYIINKIKKIKKIKNKNNKCVPEEPVISYV